MMKCSNSLVNFTKYLEEFIKIFLTYYWLFLILVILYRPINRFVKLPKNIVKFQIPSMIICDCSITFTRDSKCIFFFACEGKIYQQILLIILQILLLHWKIFFCVSTNPPLSWMSDGKAKSQSFDQTSILQPFRLVYQFFGHLSV